MPQTSLPRFSGIIPPLVTPLADQDQLDVTGTEALLEHIVRGGVHGVFALGTTGEGTSLTSSMQHQYVEIVCDCVQGRVPVLVCITDTSLHRALELAELSYGAGAAAVVSAAPYYLPMTQGDLCNYMVELADRLPLPLLLYNMPSCTKTAFDLVTVQTLSAHPNIVGLKDTSGDLDYFSQAATIANAHDDFSLLVGPEELLFETMQRGGHGGVNGGANLFPELYVGLFEAARQGDTSRAQELNELVQEVSRKLYAVSDSGAKVIQGIKTALEVRGICRGQLAPPFRSYDAREQQVVSQAVTEILALLEARMPSTVR